MDEIAVRIKELIDNEGLNNTEFAKETNLNPAIISHILSGRNKPSLQVINQIKDSFTNVNLDYLITGQGSLYNNITNVNSNDSFESNTLFGSMGSLPMEGVRVVSEPGTIPQRAPETNNESNGIIRDKQPSSPSFDNSKPINSFPESNSQKTDAKEVEQIVFFYTDGSFKAYKP